ncbi:hypothetical protein GQ53DRAFT_838066 [Thozetella sp. PMI_491]|nr:hypothetical protein GQ53DRAFT_838066 [Thozetella sp. PMI_491]
MANVWKFLFSLALALEPVRGSFSLNTVVQDYWYYVDNHLAATTSQTCLEAYNAPINCDQTLLGLVSSGSPNFNPGPNDFANMCVSSCKDSLDAYVRNVQAACSQSGDGALVEPVRNHEQRAQVPVAVVGQIFQYEYAFACSRNSTGWCYFNYQDGPDWADAEFPCEDGCAVQFFNDAHNFPGSNYTFMVYDLADQSDWWKKQWADGWDYLVQQCNNSRSASPTSLSLSKHTKTTSTIDTYTTSIDVSTTAILSTPTSGAIHTTRTTGSSTSTTISASASSNAAQRPRPPFGAFW